MAVGRVAERVSAGGHNVPEDTIRRRYRAGIHNFFRLYQPIATSWTLYNSSGPEPTLVAESLESEHGRVMGEGVRAFTPWGELAYALGKKKGYEAIRKSDEERRAPGAENFRDLFGGEPAVILLDELSIYLRKVKGREEAAQLTPFLTVLFKAVESSPGAALVFTLAIGKAGVATDAYSEENEYLASNLAEAESVAARKATLLDPTSERETVPGSPSPAVQVDRSERRS